MNHPYQSILSLPFGKIGVRNTDEELLSLDFLPDTAEAVDPHDIFGKEVARQLNVWSEDPSFRFTLPYRPRGTEFQMAVWRAISEIPLGETRTYTELAYALNSGPRAVGNACGRNPFPILVPCHRIISRSGIGGFNQSKADWLLHTKKWLLMHERQKDELILQAYG